MLLQDNLEGLQHLAIFVTDLNRSCKFYAQFGFTEKLRAQVPEDPEPVKVCFMELNGLMLEIVELGGAQRSEVASRADGHLDHVALNVKDVHKAYAELTAKGFKALEDNPPEHLNFSENGTEYFTICGPDGEKIEFSQIF